MLTWVTQFMSLTSLPIKIDMFFLVSGPLFFLIVFFLFRSSLILDWLKNRIHDLFFLFFIGLSRSQINIFFRVDARF